MSLRSRETKRDEAMEDDGIEHFFSVQAIKMVGDIRQLLFAQLLGSSFALRTKSVFGFWAAQGPCDTVARGRALRAGAVQAARTVCASRCRAQGAGRYRQNSLSLSPLYKPACASCCFSSSSEAD